MIRWWWGTVEEPLPLIRAFGDRSRQEGAAESSAVSPYEGEIKVTRCAKNRKIALYMWMAHSEDTQLCRSVNVFQLKAFICTQCTLWNEMQNHSWLFYHFTSAELSEALNCWQLEKKKKKDPSVHIMLLYFYRKTSSYLCVHAWKIHWLPLTGQLCRRPSLCVTAPPGTVSVSITAEDAAVCPPAPSTLACHCVWWTASHKLTLTHTHTHTRSHNLFLSVLVLVSSFHTQKWLHTRVHTHTHAHTRASQG